MRQRELSPWPCTNVTGKTQREKGQRHVQSEAVALKGKIKRETLGDQLQLEQAWGIH